MEGGRILIDGRDIAAVPQDELREKIGMVTQDTSLLHRSIRENILYGRPDASEEDVLRAVRDAKAEDFIAELIDRDGRSGLDAEVGERREDGFWCGVSGVVEGVDQHQHERRSRPVGFGDPGHLSLRVDPAVHDAERRVGLVPGCRGVEVSARQGQVC